MSFLQQRETMRHNVLRRSEGVVSINHLGRAGPIVMAVLFRRQTPTQYNRSFALLCTDLYQQTFPQITRSDPHRVQVVHDRTRIADDPQQCLAIFLSCGSNKLNRQRLVDFSCSF
jgi:hypothetical protein